MGVFLVHIVTAGVARQKEAWQRWGNERERPTFMLCSRENSSLLGGCSSRVPCRESRALSISRSMLPSSLLASSRSSVWMSRVAMFHWNPSCSLKNSRKAASPLRSESGYLEAAFAAAAGCCCSGCCCWCFGLVAGDLLFLFRLAAWADRQIWASRPSTWRRPFLTFGPS